MEHTSNSNLSREERRIELDHISRGKNGILELHRLHHIASGNRSGVAPVVRANDTHERLAWTCVNRNSDRQIRATGYADWT